jgi:3-hydroxy-3-methylglutaryl CoA synthase
MSSKIEVVAYANGDELANLLEDRTAAVAGVSDGWRSIGLVRYNDHKAEVGRLTECVRANQQLAQNAMDKLEEATADCDRLKMHLADHRSALDAASLVATHAAPPELSELQATIATLKALLGQARSMVNGASDEWHNSVKKVLSHE